MNEMHFIFLTIFSMIVVHSSLLFFLALFHEPKILNWVHDRFYYASPHVAPRGGPTEANWSIIGPTDSLKSENHIHRGSWYFLCRIKGGEKGQQSRNRSPAIASNDLHVEIVNLCMKSFWND